MRRALDLNAKDKSTLKDISRVYIVAGKFAEAEAILEKLMALGELNSENEYIYRTIRNNRGQRARVSLLLVCKNEEKYLQRALDSARGLVDEIIAVDTGSSDSSLNILRENGAVIVPLPWEDDFSQARNQGLAHATGDYIFWLDADEYLTDKERLSFLVLKNLLPLEDKKGFVFEVQTYDGAFPVDAAGLPPVKIVRAHGPFPTQGGSKIQGPGS